MLIPLFKHPVQVSSDRQNGRYTERSSIAEALSKQFSRYTAPSNGKPAEAPHRRTPNGKPGPDPRRQPPKRLRSDDEEGPLRKRVFTDDLESSSDELLLSDAVPTRKLISPTRKQVEVVIDGNDSSGGGLYASKPDQSRVPSPTPSDADTSRSISPILVATRDKGKDKEQRVEEDPDAWTGPLSNLFAKEPSVSEAETACVTRIFSEGLKQAEAVERSGSRRYKFPLLWLNLTRVHGRSPFVTRSEARTERYTAILEDLYGPGNILRGHGRKPNIVRTFYTILLGKNEIPDIIIYSSDRMVSRVSELNAMNQAKLMSKCVTKKMIEKKLLCQMIHLRRKRHYYLQHTHRS